MGTADEDYRSGSCNCGSVTYEVRHRIHSVLNCHCSTCLHRHGHFGAYVRVPFESLVINKAPSLRWWHSSTTEEDHGFCDTCGSALFAHAEYEREVIYVTPGTLNDSNDLVTTSHYCLDEKPSYYEVQDNLPHLDYKTEKKKRDKSKLTC